MRRRGFPVSRRHQTYDGSGSDSLGCLPWVVIGVLLLVAATVFSESQIVTILVLGGLIVACVVAVIVGAETMTVSNLKEPFSERGITFVVAGRLSDCRRNNQPVTELKTGARVAVGATTDAIWVTDGTQVISMLRPVWARPEVTWVVINCWQQGYTVYVDMDNHPTWETSMPEYLRQQQLATNVARLLEDESFPARDSLGATESRPRGN